MAVQPNDLLLVNRGGQDYKYPAEDFIGPGVAEGGGDGQMLVKKSNTDYDTEWVTPRPPQDLSGYATTTDLQNEADARDTGDKVVLGLVEANQNDIDSLESTVGDIPGVYATKSALATATAALPYTLETDKTVRSADLPTRQARDGATTMYAGGEIYLTDNLGYYSNVRFEGQGNVTTSSTAQGIVVDGSALMPKNLLSLPELS